MSDQNTQEDSHFSGSKKEHIHKVNHLEDIDNVAQLSAKELKEIIASLIITKDEFTTILEGYRSEKQQLTNQLFQSNHIIGQIYASNSWRITFPIRWTSLKIKIFLRKIKNGVKIIHEQGIKSFILKVNNKLLHQQDSALQYFSDIKDLNSDHETILIVSHEASRTGAPILALNIAQELSKKYNIVVMLLGSGSLLDYFKKTAKILICTTTQERYDISTNALILDKLLTLCKIKFAIVNSVESRAVLPHLAKCFVPTIALIHEFASYTRPSSAISDAIFWAYKSIFSAKIVWQNAVDTYSDIGNRPATIIPQGRCNIFIEQDIQLMAKEKLKIINALRPQYCPINTLIIIGLGSVQLRKGVDLFIECAARILNTTKLPCRFVWIGHGYNPEHDTTYSVYLSDQIKRANLEKYITFLEETPQLEFVYQQADILLLSSRLDPLPNVAIDAISYGLPLVCFEKTTGIVDILQTYGLTNECIATYLDTSDLASKVRILMESPELRRQISNRFKEIAIQLFSIETYVNRIENLALKGVLDMQQAHQDTVYISSSNLLDLNFFPHPQWPKFDIETYARYFVRGIASEINMRKPCPGFHPGIYQEHKKGSIENCNPYVHFLESGSPNGPWKCEVISPLYHAQNIKSLNRIALHIHVYYADLIALIIDNLMANEVRPDLLISVPSNRIMTEITNILQHYNGKIAAIQVVPNRGRDIGPLLTTFGEKIVKDYEVIGHIHTKKSLALNDQNIGKLWFAFLLENLIGGKNKMADRILGRIDEDNTIGLVFPDDPYIIGWSSNYIIAKSIADKMNLGSLPEKPLNFPNGCMFWARTQAIKPLIELNLGWNDFPEEPLPIDGTLLHSIERLLPFIAKKAGFRYVLTNVPGISR